MTLNGIFQIALYCIVIILLVRPLGLYMTRVFNGERTFLSPILRPIERVLYALAGVDADVEQDWLVLGPRAVERRVAPGMPAHRLVGGGFEVGGRLRSERVGHSVVSK